MDNQIFAVIKAARSRDFPDPAYHRGLRASEPGLLQLSGLERARRVAFHPERQEFHLARRYRLTAIERTALRALAEGPRPGRRVPLFPSRQKRARGLGIHRHRLDQLFRGYCKTAGIRPEKSHMHALKHSCGTHLSELGESAEMIQDSPGTSRRELDADLHASSSQRRRDEERRRVSKNWR